MIKRIKQALRTRNVRRGGRFEIDETQQPRDRDGRCCVSHFSIQQGVVRWNESRMGLLCLVDEVPKGKPLMKFRIGRHLHPQGKPMMSATVGAELSDHGFIPKGWCEDGSVRRVFFLGTLWQPIVGKRVVTGERDFFVCERTESGAFAPGFVPVNTVPQSGDYFAVWLPEAE